MVLGHSPRQDCAHEKQRNSSHPNRIELTNTSRRLEAPTEGRTAVQSLSGLLHRLELLLHLTGQAERGGHGLSDWFQVGFHCRTPIEHSPATLEAYKASHMKAHVSARKMTTRGGTAAVLCDSTSWYRAISFYHLPGPCR